MLQCNVAVCVDGTRLVSLVLIAAGTFCFWSPESLDSATLALATIKDLYLQSGAHMSPSQESQARVVQAELKSLGERLSDYLREEQDGWGFAAPINFHPSSSLECCCGACPECLARAGVPIRCEQAWTHDGFGKHLRPHCSGER